MLETINGQYIVLGVCCLIGTLALTTQWFVLVPSLGGWSSPQTLKSLGPLNLGILVLSYYYYLAIVTDPGKVPEGWEPPYSLIQRPEEVQSSKGETGPRFCRSCDAYKPPRAHHCRVCRRCVLKMDHHCPWINNCVGHGNYPHFIRFVFSVSLTCGYALYLLVWRLIQILDMNSLQNALRPVKRTEMIFMVIDIVGVFITVFSVSILSVYHGYCVIKGQSTIEAWERSKVKNLIKKKKIMPVDFPYDLGPFRNIASVLGNNILLWPFPLSSIGDGLTYTLLPNTDPKLPYYWPPRDPNDLRPSIFDQQQEQQYQYQQQSNHTQLVRRDSEGYLVREISIEERMKMLDELSGEYHHNVEETTAITTNTVDLESSDVISSAGIHPSFYYYDSGSDSDYMDDNNGSYNNNSNGNIDTYINDDELLWEDIDDVGLIQPLRSNTVLNKETTI